LNEQDPERVIIEALGETSPSMASLIAEYKKSFPLSPIVQNEEQRIRDTGGSDIDAKFVAIHFLQKRCLPDRQIHLVSVETDDGRQEYHLCFLLRNSQNHWESRGDRPIRRPETRIFSQQSSSNDGTRTVHSSIILNPPHKGTPEVHLSSTRLKNNGFWAGGFVRDNGFDVAQVRLISEQGLVFEDTVQDGIVLFVSDQNTSRPVRIEFYDHAGNLVGTQHMVPPEKRL
jgi:hypothetical protein